MDPPRTPVQTISGTDKDDAVTLGLLEAIEARHDVTQRHLSRRTGIALGLINSYLKRCVRKGLVKMQQAPANRYLYYLTPQGFAEKSRLTAQYLSVSLSFYRRAGDSCREVLARCETLGYRRIVLCGASDLAEIAVLRAGECPVEVVAVYDVGGTAEAFLGVPVIREPLAVVEVDAWVVTDLDDPHAMTERLGRAVPDGRLFAPSVLGLVLPPGR